MLANSRLFTHLTETQQNTSIHFKSCSWLPDGFSCQLVYQSFLTKISCLLKLGTILARMLRLQQTNKQKVSGQRPGNNCRIRRHFSVCNTLHLFHYQDKSIDQSSFNPTKQTNGFVWFRPLFHLVIMNPPLTK